MQYRYSKPVDPQAFQSVQLNDLRAYQNEMHARAQKFRKEATIRTHACLLCGSKQLTPLFKVLGYTYLQCTDCTHLSLDEHLDTQTLEKFYASDARYSATYSQPEQIKYRLEKIAQPKVQFVMDTIKQKSGTWLDIGTAIGDVLKAVEQDTNWKATGLEISAQSAAIGREVFAVDIEESTLSNFHQEKTIASFDVVSAFGYFDVIDKPATHLTQLVDLVKPGGYVVIGDTVADSFTTTLQQSYPDLTLRHLIPPTIINAFTEQSLTTALAKRNCHPVAAWRFGLDFFELLKYLCLLQEGFQKTPIFQYLQAQSNQFQAVLDKQKASDYIIMIAQKQK